MLLDVNQSVETCLRHRLDDLTKILNDSTLILNFKVFCKANKQDTELEIV